MKSTTAAFWDTSALVPLCVSEQATSRLKSVLRDHQRIVVWWGTPVEMRSAFARLGRSRALSRAGMKNAVACLEELRNSWHEVVPSEHVRSLAESLPERLGLRATDGLQLAAALVWCKERPRERPFVCFDRKLCRTADEAGFSTVIKV